MFRRVSKWRRRTAPLRPFSVAMSGAGLELELPIAGVWSWSREASFRTLESAVEPAPTPGPQENDLL